MNESQKWLKNDHTLPTLSNLVGLKITNYTPHLKHNELNTVVRWFDC